MSTDQSPRTSILNMVGRYDLKFNESDIAQMIQFGITDIQVLIHLDLNQVSLLGRMNADTIENLHLAQVKLANQGFKIFHPRQAVATGESKLRSLRNMNFSPAARTALTSLGFPDIDNLIELSAKEMKDSGMFVPRKIKKILEYRDRTIGKMACLPRDADEEEAILSAIVEVSYKGAKEALQTLKITTLDQFVNMRAACYLVNSTGNYRKYDQIFRIQLAIRAALKVNPYLPTVELIEVINSCLRSPIPDDDNLLAS
jgi:hypothetical protein